MGNVWKEQKGTILAIVFLAIAMLLFPGVILTTAGDIMDWTGDGGNITQFTGLSSIVGIWPMLVLVTIVFGSLGMIAISGLRAYKGEQAGMMLVLGIILIMIFMVTYQIILDAVDEALADPSIGDFTGLEAILEIVPMLVFVGLGFESLALIGGGAYTAYKKFKK